MAKTAEAKKRETSIHSRAARRAASPLPRTTDAGVTASEYKPWLHKAQNAGISKQQKTKQLTRQQKARQQRGFEKADINSDKLLKKVADSKGRARKVQARKADWDDLNGKSALLELEKNKKVKGGVYERISEPDGIMDATKGVTDSKQLRTSHELDAVIDGAAVTCAETPTKLGRPQTSTAVSALDEVDEIT